MKHLDARAIRERLNQITLALTTLESNPGHAHRVAIAHRAQRALQEIAVLVTDDELEEHGIDPVPAMQRARSQIRSAAARNPVNG